jgi:hypothetical protein
MSDPATTPTSPGWYPDPHNPGSARYWNGTGWGPAASAPVYQAPPPLRAPEGTNPNTVWEWLIVFLPVLSFIPLLFIPWNVLGTFDPNRPESMLEAELSLFLSPGYLGAIGLSFVLYAVTVLLAFLDSRELTRRGVPQPFLWPFAFLGGLVYTIGRTVIVYRRTGRGLGPIWGLIGVFVLSIVASFVMVAQMLAAMSQMFENIPRP